jgi:hypothetical protein
MTEHTDKINKQREVIAEEKSKNTLQGLWMATRGDR